MQSSNDFQLGRSFVSNLANVVVDEHKKGKAARPAQGETAQTPQADIAKAGKDADATQSKVTPQQVVATPPAADTSATTSQTVSPPCHRDHFWYCGRVAEAARAEQHSTGDVVGR